jgi:hypothetical protein
VKFLSAALLVTTIQASQADEFCVGLELLFAKTDNTLSLPEPFSTKATCQTSVNQTGGTSQHCAWPFAYRAGQAKQVFETLITAVPDCLGDATQVSNDQGVNHPDFYDLRIFRTDKVEVGVSLKDKASLQETYVFLRIE